MAWPNLHPRALFADERVFAADDLIETPMVTADEKRFSPSKEKPHRNEENLDYQKSPSEK